ncbi:NuoF family protein [Chrysiogenes arsenatis]|uniref:NuoF family protein n=1 Tax=Chrysiogenes arsenatis TaxID=309797 RepID=UPI00041D3E4D|nr:NuoF family protein [Chrysiogenes arsenatis]
MNRADLQQLAETVQEQLAALDWHILVCFSTPCLASGAAAIKEALDAALQTAGLPATVAVTATGCVGPCSRGPLVTVKQRGRADVLYEKVTPEFVTQIVDALSQTQLPTAQQVPADLPFFQKQKRIVLENSGKIDPENIEQAIAAGAYSALAKAIAEMTPDEVCEEIVKSGLRGRGGGGYSTGLKWQLVRKAPGNKKFIVANGDEGDPGAYMDRTLMESDPHRILEGMALAGYAVGAEQGYVYVRGEYPIAAKRLQKAIKDAERAGLLGGRVLDGSFSFRVDVRIGAGAFVCGEETALMASIMGLRGQPMPRPPYPAQKGLWGLPTLLNNVETFGNIAPIIRDGAEAYAAIGTPKSRGTKIFALCGEVENNGLIEVPMGISLREIVYDIGGGVSNNQQFKAAQTGGPSGGCIPQEHLDTPVDYESLQALGSIMGSGGLIVMGDKTCMVDVAKFFMEFCLDESCGKCTPCRAGTAQLYRLLNLISNGSATEKELLQLEELCVMVRDTSLCGLGMSAPNPVLSTLHYFRDEYLAHIRDRHCLAGVCRISEVPRLDMADELLRRIAAGRLDGEALSCP